MKTIIPTTKSEVYALLGGSAKTAAEALGYPYPQAIYNMTEPLPHRIGLAVIGAVFLQQQASNQAPAPRPARPVKRTRWLARRAA